MATSGPFAVIGHVHKTHGLKGEVSVAPAAETSLCCLVGLSVWFVPPPATIRSATIEGVRRGPKGELVQFSGVDSIQSASDLVDRDILVRSDELPDEWLGALQEEVDEIGFSVTDSVHGPLGAIVELIETGANDVWVLEGPFGEVLIPVIDDVVDEIDYEAGAVRVTLLPGLLPGEDEFE